MNKKELIEQAEKSGRCKKCPTYHGLINGTDPEAYEYIQDPEVVEAEIDRGSRLYCPWRKKKCAVYPFELQYAKECHDNDVKPEILINPEWAKIFTLDPQTLKSDI